MEEVTIYQVILALLAFLGSGRAWSFYEKRALMKERSENLLRDDCRERILKLESLLESSSKEKDKMRELMAKMSKDITEIKVKLVTLEKDNELLEKDNALLKKRIEEYERNKYL